LPDAFHAEFTGERVIPGRVEDNLFNEHLARYRFTAHLMRDLGLQGAVLDAGCGAGYGTAELAKCGTRVLGIDVSPDALAHAQANYAADANVRFEQASCTAIPAEDGAFQVIAAFEVIEHLADWRVFLADARRVLDRAGLFLVSTPNRLYYAESRRKAGPNPFHVHEFTEEEFRTELESVFPQVKMLLQNHVEGIAFSGAATEGAAALEISDISDHADDPSEAHFFLAVCGKQTLPPIRRFVFIPESGNVLQTRERHIALLDGEILQKNQWIATEKAEREQMIAKVRDLEAELEEHNRWARQANQEAERRAQLVAGLQADLRKSNEWAQTQGARLEAELRKSNEWARTRDAEAVERGLRVEQLQAEVAQATAWARVRDADAEDRGRRVEQVQVELAGATAWARARDAEAEERGQRVVELQAELAQATDWARARDAEAEERGRRVVELQEEMAREQENNLATVLALNQQMAESSAVYEAAIEQWSRDKEASDRWAMETERTLSAERDAARDAFVGKQIEHEDALDRITSLQAELEELRARFAEASARLDMIARSRWVRLGRTIRVGPEIDRTRP
jgi:SAM-dependent methyltransferase